MPVKKQPAPPGRLLAIGEVAELTGFPEATLRHWRLTGKGPKAGRFGRHLRYAERDVNAWIDQQIAADAAPSDG